MTELQEVAQCLSLNCGGGPKLQSIRPPNNSTTGNVWQISTLKSNLRVISLHVLPLFPLSPVDLFIYSSCFMSQGWRKTLRFLSHRFKSWARLHRAWIFTVGNFNEIKTWYQPLLVNFLTFLWNKYKGLDICPEFRWVLRVHTAG